MLELLGGVPLLPLLGFISLVLAGRQFSRPLIALIGIGSVASSALLVALIGLQFLNGTMQPVRLEVGSWLALDGLSAPFGWYLDALSMTMLCVVTGVGLLIHIYSAGFMADDPDYARFFAYMNLFVGAMLTLVLADNLVLLYLGWEGVGLGSYLLIGFWYTNPDNGYAARKAFVMTRVGDTAMALGLFLLFAQLHSFDIQSLMASAERQWPAGSWLPMLSAALLLGGALGKSAQLPLQTWLPDAMAGPTPVSALIHAATMVTAGVYLIARTHVLFELAPAVHHTVALIGAATLFIAACSALTQTDIKRILAYSTISQIGYMFLALGVGAWSAGIFHLMAHAFFKALLFLSAGAVIFSLRHEHNIFKMGGLRKTMPLTFYTFVIGAAALSALPVTSGFYSKHEILMATFAASPLLWAVGCAGALLTAIYSFRLIFVVFFGPPQQTPDKRIGNAMAWPMLVLAVLALTGWLLRIPLTSVFATPDNATHQQPVEAIAVITIVAPLFGLLIAALFYWSGTFSAQRLLDVTRTQSLRLFLLSGWKFDALYNALFLWPYTSLCKLNKSDAFDSVYTSLAWLSRELHQLGSATQTGRIRWYASSMALGAAAIIAIGLLS